MRLSKSREKYFLQQYFKTKNNKGLPTSLLQFGSHDGVITDEHLYFITRYVSEINTVVLGGTTVTEQGLFYLKQIKSIHYLDLRELPLNDSNLEAILHFSMLQNLDIKNTKVSIQGIQKLLETFPKLETIRVDIPKETSTVLEIWKKRFPKCKLIINLL
ncbi:hypothetical protein [Flavobacterium sp. J27]|uniref:hypothetical protein n=1 Tax=Flavobacterium sp. J27 TaxID=2060419 RepID=UPI0010327394|nr:hypothetical protein [Flavobacterium sp. J27]